MRDKLLLNLTSSRNKAQTTVDTALMLFFTATRQLQLFYFVRKKSGQHKLP